MLAVHDFVRLVPGRNAVAAVRAPSHPRRRRPPKYGALALLRHGVSGRPWPRAWPEQPLRNSCDVVIIGGGGHGLAAAYYLAVNHGITHGAVPHKGYIRNRGAGRETAPPPSNQPSPAGRPSA